MVFSVTTCPAQAAARGLAGRSACKTVLAQVVCCSQAVALPGADATPFAARLQRAGRDSDALKLRESDRAFKGAHSK